MYNITADITRFRTKICTIYRISFFTETVSYYIRHSAPLKLNCTRSCPPWFITIIIKNVEQCERFIWFKDGVKIEIHKGYKNFINEK